MPRARYGSVTARLRIAVRQQPGRTTAELAQGAGLTTLRAASVLRRLSLAGVVRAVEATDLRHAPRVHRWYAQERV